MFAYEKYKALAEKNRPIGITRGFATFIDIADLAGSLGIVLSQHRSGAQPVGRSRTLDYNAAVDWPSPEPPRIASRARQPFLA